MLGTGCWMLVAGAVYDNIKAFTLLSSIKDPVTSIQDLGSRTGLPGFERKMFLA